MKLLMCEKCCDIFSLSLKLKTCSCGVTSGKYIDKLNAEYKGKALLIGINNDSLKKAFWMQMIDDKDEGSENCSGSTFEAFIIPKKTKTLKRVTNFSLK